MSAGGFRVLVTYKGETGYLRGETGIDLRTLWGVTFDENNTATHPSRQRAERIVRKVIGRFDAVEIEPVPSTFRAANDPAQGFSCAECGTDSAADYVVTVLDIEQPRETRTEVCSSCAGALRS
ncbi:MAG: hypothetical protein JF592_18520 [Microbacterium sp.]|uniref:hypothetical protein n=1 Tax=Microbacterium sp. TaxID=51671 RepID=UPI001D957487|nr:hypothetical protein [Microbacterium sp.]MBW8764544.1 hypothetical protein [Microbacterium sp.]